MDMKKIAGICILIPILLSGCGNQSDTKTAAAASTTQPQQTAAATDGGQKNQQNRPAMDPAQRQLFTTFQTLIMLDKADGLAITKEQAQAMLPVAQDIETKKELSDDNKTKLLANLTDAQKTFITDAETRMSNRGNGGGGNFGKNGNGQGKTNGGTGNAQSPDASAKPNANATDGTGNGQQAGGKRQNGGNGGNANGGGQNGGGGNRPAGGGQMGDPGKQFIELLQTKLK
ncbi:hypothetical protein A8709_06300 [Paenibacillus pectinilyticus]|uniref:Uncharacterized protein n=1 Tax=Paenibacillus pectinilyticus TaxID=512399 RepID=A0A1C0ZTD9_9BACL|nr:hypothetical protein [Paenibacillus pectinilyticus]OCT11283.1 hypothetical protein A8709_06300 [Paenibacillus pectinilyticus]